MTYLPTYLGTVPDLPTPPPPLALAPLPPSIMEHGYVSSSHPSQPQCPHGLICHAVNGPGFPFEETAPCDLRSGHEARSEMIDPSVQGHVLGFKGTQSLSVCLFVIDINYR